MAEELKKLLKLRTKGKSDPTCIFIKIREAEDVTDLLPKEKGKGITELRVRTSKENLPKIYTHGYLIDLANLRLKYKEIKKKHEIQDLLLEPTRIANKETRSLISTLSKNFGGILPDGRDKMFWKTERFKKKKDAWAVKRKSM